MTTPATVRLTTTAQMVASVPNAAEDYPVWSNGSQERMVCALSEGHGGSHTDGATDWTWAAGKDSNHA